MNELVERLDDEVEEGFVDVPIWRKTALTIREAAAYSNIGINRLDRMLRTPGCTFVLWVGTKKLVKRIAFEKFLEDVLEI